MADINVERKRRSLLPWIVLALLAALLLYWFLRDGRDEGAEPATPPAPDSALIVTPAPGDVPAADSAPAAAPATDSAVPVDSAAAPAPPAVRPPTDSPAAGGG